MNTFVKKLIFGRARPLIRRVYHFTLDTLDFFHGQRDPLIAPRSVSCIGAGDSKKIGDEFLQYFRDLCGLQPLERVFDVGCGTGRMAAALAKYLTPEGRYEGFDIVESGIQWCLANITSRYPNFHFQFADIFNRAYNPRGKFFAHQYRFPYDNDSFDFVFLTSVFTHMLPDAIEHYFSEISRVLKPGGRCLITYFLLNDESKAMIEKKKSSQDFSNFMEGYRTTDPDTPESAVAYEEETIRGWYQKYGFAIQEAIRYGSWCGREKFLSYQDIIVASK